jgi:phosphatidylserine/phosphatidylglycerophosphate/cardiolipin synthase-like enzyme
MYSPLKPIISPLALKCTNTVTVSLPWFVQRTEHNPALTNFRALVNGEEAFGAVYDAILAARHSIDIVCWGFQPSMYFKRGPGNSSWPIGELLKRKGEQGVRVRLLCWADPLRLAQWGENMAPGSNLASMLSPGTANEVQRAFDRRWYLRANLSNVSLSSLTGLAENTFAELVPSLRDTDKAFANLEFATRSFDLSNRIELAYQTWVNGKDSGRSTAMKAKNSLAMSMMPTHHQKTVLIDYELPQHSVGFVMGHNMLDAYWDRDNHSAMMWRADLGRNGLNPRQDISSRVRGPILADINQNFCRAWDAATGQQLEAARRPIRKQIPFLPEVDTPTMAQILRTYAKTGEAGSPPVNACDAGGSQRFKRDIEKMYLQAVNNVTRYIYIENQYFRYPPLAEAIKYAVQRQIECGRDPGKHGAVHLFVVTNDNDEAVTDGSVNTYRMLEALGRPDGIPAVAKLEREDEVRAQIKLEYQRGWEEMKKEWLTTADRIRGLPETGAMGKRMPQTQPEWDEQLKAFKAVEARVAALRARLGETKETIVPSQIPGLKVHVCSLVAPDSLPGAWQHVYVHSKLMIVDDVFMTLGSANINTRSMMADSELNICHENAAISHPLRTRLWNMHTGGMGAQDDVGKAFEQWGKIIDRNISHREYHLKPYASLVRFMYASDKRRLWD